MVGDRGPVKGLGELDLDSADFHGLALGEAVSIGGHQPGAADISVERISRMQVLLAEIGFLQRIVRNVGRGLLWGVGQNRLGAAGGFIARGREQKNGACECERNESNGIAGRT